MELVGVHYFSGEELLVMTLFEVLRLGSALWNEKRLSGSVRGSQYLSSGKHWRRGIVLIQPKEKMGEGFSSHASFFLPDIFGCLHVLWLLSKHFFHVFRMHQKD